ncbi:starch synthase (maltosyl-transferring) [Raineyella antarctica]|uniref:Alpha-1,4-glucan:maltose-1-phosphate maltosyltransferase n=2 Tax=Raineyella antarctica TaxID=1577474 RepID=A0A1G6GTZ7_9ACTN|nr:starch synthase (maltosyl-transferring) [Raineyella antarctica]
MPSDETTTPQPTAKATTRKAAAKKSPAKKAATKKASTTARRSTSTAAATETDGTTPATAAAAPADAPAPAVSDTPVAGGKFPARHTPEEFAADTPAAPAPRTELSAVEPGAPAVGSRFGRIPVTDVSPVLAGGAYPAKAVAGEAFPVRATIFREGHDAVSASVITISPEGEETRTDMQRAGTPGLDGWEAWVTLPTEGDWRFRVEGWDDPWATWLHAAEIKLTKKIDVDLVCAEGQLLLEGAALRAEQAGKRSDAAVLRGASIALLAERPVDELVELIDSNGVRRAMRLHGPRLLVSPSPEYPVRADRERALFSSWYEFFPRSQGAYQDEDGLWHSGTFAGSIERLEDAAAMGFDVVYLPPVHPVGQAFRKGRNNTLTPEPGDPGSVWAVGSAEGGHDAIHPDLGTFEDFDRFVGRAKELGVEVAIDLALQASPDHPWAKEHPEWFTERVDGTIAYAENPPKKYQDIYPINFDRDPEGIYHEVLRIVRLWIDHGVTIFRVDNPHTKPLNFWAWLLAEVHRTNPEVLFLAEAFTRPAMLQSLGRIGFHQSYTYFTWRTERWELEEYVNELAYETAAWVRPNFFVNTPDILHAYLQYGGPAAFTIRAVLAATLSPSWGMYSGYELFEHEAVRPGSEEYLNSEKYEYRPRNYDQQPNLKLLVGKLNAARKAHPALQRLRNIQFQNSENPQVIAYIKRTGEGDDADAVIVAVNLDSQHTQESTIHLDMGLFGLGEADKLRVRDELTGQEFDWGAHDFVRLTPQQPAHVLAVISTEQHQD